MKKLITKNYDITGNSFIRVLFLGMLNKVMPVGNFKHGLGLRPAFTLFVLHYFGNPLFWCSVRFEKYLHKVYMKLKKRS